MSDEGDRCIGGYRRAKVRWRGALLAGLLLVLPSIGGALAEEFSAQEVARMLAREPSGPQESADDQLLEKLSGVGRGDPAWPLYAFLRAEMLLQMKRPKLAAEAYRGIIEHAASNPYQDTWGSNGVVAFALYRWLGLQAQPGFADRGSFEKVSAHADGLLQTRLVRSAFRPYAILSSMPLFEEQIYYALATEAMRVGLPKKAATYFLNYLTRMRSEVSAPESDPLYRVVLDQGISTPDRIALFRGKRFVTLGKPAAALPFLEVASLSKHEQTRLEATYLHARASSKMSRAKRSAAFREVNQFAASDELAQSALLYDGLQYGPEEPEYRRILTQLVQEYPDDSASDEALFWLAWGARITGDPGQSKAWYEKLRKLSTESGYLSRVAIDTALALIWRGQPGDIKAAADVLQGFVDDQPNSDDRPRALFWLARIAEDQGKQAEARLHFTETSKADWFGYYGLRARMHLASGGTARSHALIESPALKDEIRAAYSRPDPAPSQLAKGRGIYQRRLQGVLDNGLYRLALSSEHALRRANASKRLQEFSFEELDALGLVAPISVMMALRQDALAAADADPSLSGRLLLARHLGDAVGDWPVLLSLVHPASIRPVAKRSALMREPAYLRTAYPPVFEPLVRKAASEHRVSPVILYAVMRQESFFYPAALSAAGALGLFQFTKGTFDDADRQWRLLERSGAPDRAAFLMDERLSIPLGARWFAEMKLPAFDNDPLFAILAHHSGDGRVNRWRRIWKQRGWTGDIEMMVESFRMHDFVREGSELWGIEARNFARHVITDIALADAIGLYRNAPPR